MKCGQGEWLDGAGCMGEDSNLNYHDKASGSIIKTLTEQAYGG